MTSSAPIGLIAGSGDLPHHFLESCRKAGRRVVVAGVEQEVSLKLRSRADVFRVFPLGRLGAVLRYFKRHGVREAALQGKVHHQSAFRLRPDWAALWVLVRLKDYSGEGLMKAAAKAFESRGIRLLDCRTYMEDLLIPAGVWTKRRPKRKEKEWVQHGWRCAKALSAWRVGQSVVLKKNAVAAVEAMEGTDALIERAGNLAGKGCILVKVTSPKHDFRFDVPTIGLSTIRRLIRRRAAGIVVEAEKCFVLDREEVLKTADRHGLFVWARNEKT